jgi:ATP-dependent DNA helicase 2 subunit 2
MGPSIRAAKGPRNSERDPFPPTQHLLTQQRQIYHKRKTDKCGVVLVGTEGVVSFVWTLTPSDSVKGTDNRVHETSGDGYENVTEFLPIEQPTPDTLTKIAALQPTEDVVGDRE